MALGLRYLELALRERWRRRCRPLRVAACAGIASVFVGSSARAEVSFSLSWRAERGTNVCVIQAPLREAVEEKLGRKPFVDREHARIVIEGEETAIGRDRFRARVTERDRRGTVLGVRELEAQSCASLRRAATLIVALIIDPYFAGKRVEDGGDEPAAPPRVAEAPKEAPAVTRDSPLQAPVLVPPSPPSRPRALAFDLSLGLGAGTTVGVLPSASVTLFTSARLVPRGSRWSFDWRGGYSFPERLRDGPVVGDFSAVEQHTRACFAFWRWSSSKFDGCAGIFGAAVIPSTSGVRSSGDRWRALLGPTAAVAFEQRSGPLFGRLELGLTFPLREYAFSYLGLAGERKGFYSTEAILFFFAISGFGTLS